MTETRTSSLWRLTGPEIESDVFAPDRRDAVVVGAGITGLLTAVLLARAGQRVTVLEARRTGSVTTGNTTGKLSLLQGTALSEIREHCGDEVLRAYVEANREGQAWLLRQLETWGIDAERRLACTYADDPAQVESLEREAAAAASAGLQVTELSGARLSETRLPFETFGALTLEQQAQVQPMTVLAELARELRERGGALVERCRVREVDRGGGSVVIRSDLGSITAETCVLATGTPILDRGMFFAKLEPSRSFAAAYRVPAGVAPRGMYLSAGEPHRSLRTARGPAGEEVLVVGGGAHVTGRSPDTAREIRKLDEWTFRTFASRDRVTWWGAQDYRSHSRVPFAGPLPRGGGRIYTATGYNKWGMTNGVAAALTIASDVLGGHLEWAQALREHAMSLPTVRAAVDATAAVGGRFVSGWAAAESRAAEDVEHAGALAEGEGVVAREGVSPVGIARVDGRICGVSAVCPHLGGILNWNSAELSWDCPLHGSRFSASGERLEGPALEDLRAEGEPE